MAEVDDYFDEKHQEILAGSYTDAEGERLKCWETATTMARLLLNSGEDPEICTVVVPRDADTDLPIPIAPRVYDGEVSFTSHVVCVADGKVFDPLADEPVPVADYSQTVFGQPGLGLRHIDRDEAIEVVEVSNMD